MTEQEIRDAIDQLVQELQDGTVDLVTYGERLGKLTQDLETIMEEKVLPTQFEEQDPALGVRSFQLGEQPLPMLQAEQDVLTAAGGQWSNLTPQEAEQGIQEAFKVRQEELEKEIEAQKYTTGEFEEPVKPALGLSTVRDPMSATVYDEELDTYREAGTGELLYESLFRQVKATPEQREAFLEQKAQARSQYAQSLMDQGLDRDEVVRKLGQYDDLNAKLGEMVNEQGYVVETPTAWAFRQINSGSAAMAIPYQALQEGLFGLVSDEQAYQKTDEGVLRQFAVNQLLNQGMYSAVVDYMPADMKDSNWTLVAGFGGEIAAPVTPLGLASQTVKAVSVPVKALGKTAGSAKLVKAGMVIDTPVRSILSTNEDVLKINAASKEVENALRSVGADNPAKEATRIQNELAKKGTLNSVTVREKGAEAIADVYAGNAALDRAVKNAQAVGDDLVHFEDLDIIESPYINSVFAQHGTNAIPVEELAVTVQLQDSFLDNLRATKGGTDPALARAYRIYANGKDFTPNPGFVSTGEGWSTGTMKTADMDLLNPRLKSQALLNADLQGFALDEVNIIRNAADEPLDIASAQKLNRLFDEGGDVAVTTRQRIRKSLDAPRTRYMATRGAVGEAIQDNLLKNIPEDYVYVSKDVAVPSARLRSPKGKEMTRQVNQLLEGAEFKNGGYFYDPGRARRLLEWKNATGAKLPRTVIRKIEQMATEGTTLGLSFADMRNLKDGVSGAVAKKVLGGVTLRTGAATAEIAEIPLELRGTVIPLGQGQRATRSIFAQGLRNARRVVSGRAYKFSPIKSDMEYFQSPVARRLQQELQRANNAALKQVDTDMQAYISRAVADGRTPQDGFNDYLANLRSQEEALTYNLMTSREVQVEASMVDSMGMGQAERTAIISQEPIDMGMAAPIYIDQPYTPTRLKKMAALYGDEAVEDYIQGTLGIRKNAQGVYDDDALETIYTNINNIESAMKQQVLYPIRREAWDQVLGSFFGSDRIKYLYENQLIEGILVKNPDLPVYAPDNLADLTIENFKGVINKMRQVDPTLEGKGLFDGMVMQEEAFMVPLLEYATGVQRRLNANAVVSRMVNDDPSFLLNLDTEWGVFPMDRYSSTGFERSFQQNVMNNIEEVIIRNTDEMGIPLIDEEDLIQGIRERLMDGIERDLIANQSRDVKKRIATRLLGRIAQEGTTEIDLSKFAIEMYKEGIITSKTIDRVSNYIESTIGQVIRKLNTQAAKGGTLAVEEQQLLRRLDAVDEQQAMTSVAGRNPKLMQRRAGFQARKQQLQSELQVEQAKVRANPEDYIAEEKVRKLTNDLKIVDRELEKVSKQLTDKIPAEMEFLKKKINQQLAKTRQAKAKSEAAGGRSVGLMLDQNFAQKVVDDFREEYLMRISGAAKGDTTAIFSELHDNMRMFFDTYGLQTGDLTNFMKTSANRIDYLSKNDRFAIVYGDAIVQEVRQMTELVADSRFVKELETLRMGENRASFTFVWQKFWDTLSGVRRWSVSHMLGGGFLPAVRFFGMNRLTAPHIFFTSVGGALTMRGGKTALKFVGTALTGDLARAADLVTGRLIGKNKFESFIDSNRLLYAPADEIIIDATKYPEAGRNYTAGELRQLIDYHGIEFSRTKIEFYETEIKNMLTSVDLTIGGAKKSVAGRAWAKFDPAQQNIYSQYAQYQDAELRRLVFLEALKGGLRPEDAAQLGRRSMLDYNSLTKFEKERVAKQIYFYAFMRTMSSEVVNGTYRAFKGGMPLANAVPRIVRAQDAMNRTQGKDYYDMSNQQLGRIYNYYHGTVDGVNLYMSGPQNPQMQMFDLMANTAMYGLGVVRAGQEFAEDPSMETAAKAAMAVPQQGQDAFMNAAYHLLIAGSTGSPIGQWMFDTYDVKSQDFKFNPPSIPTEIVSYAESSGNLPELIKMYGLVEKKYVSGGRPLSSQGKQYVFADGKSYQRYLNHRIIGLGTSMIATELGLSQNYGQRTRAIADYQKMMQIGQPTGFNVPDPTDKTKTITIPDAQYYLKSRVRQDEPQGDWQQTLMTAYMIGMTTPTQSTNRSKSLEFNMMKLLKSLESKQRDLQEE